MKSINLVVWVLLVVGGLNWGLIGVFNYDIIAVVFGAMSGVSRVIYALVGLSAVWAVLSFPKMMKKA